MEKGMRELLEDCKETMQWIVDCEFWEQIKEGSSCKELITEIDNVASEDKIEIGIYSYEDDNGKKVYDVEEMFAELDREICKLQEKENANENI